jgi:protease-4
MISTPRGGCPRAVATLALLSILGLPPHAAAQDPDAADAPPELLEAPIPWQLSADHEGIESVFGHAAGLGFLEGAELGIGTRGIGKGFLEIDRFLAGASTRLGPIGLGVGLVLPTGDDDGLQRMDTSLALRLGRHLAVGLRMERHEAEENGGHALDGFERMGVSTTWRPARSLSVALGVDNVDRPAFGAGHLEPTLTGSVALRPGTERMAIGAEGGTALKGPEQWRVGGTLRFMATPGLEVGGYGRFVDGEGAPERIEWGAFLALRQGRVGGETSIQRIEPSGAPGASSTHEARLIKISSRLGPRLFAPSGKIVRLTVEGAVPEGPKRGFFSKRRPAWAQVLVSLNAMASDDSVHGVHVELLRAPGWGQSWELRRTLARLKAAGKYVSVRLGWADMRSIYVASVADKVFGQPSGGVEVNGLSVTRTYLADLLGHLGLQAQFVAIGDYKSAPDSLTRTGPTEADIEQTRALLADFQAEWTSAVGAGRNLDDAAIEGLFAKPFQSMGAAHASGLVDRVVSDTDLEKALTEAVGTRIHFEDRYERAPESWAPWGGPATLAVVPITGTISAGTQDGGPFATGSTTDGPTVRLLEALRRDRKIRAVVLRIDSPGGGVLASDRIYEAVRKLAKAKTVVVSLANVAASGGYYIACGAEKIFTTPVTVTGSIGIFGGKVNASALFERIGLGTHTEKSHPHGDHRGAHRAWSDEELTSLREALGDHYQRFLSVVSGARGLSAKDTLARAGGRIYSGSRARKHGLVDAEGSLWDAIEAARRTSGASGPVRVVIPRASWGGLGWKSLSGALAAQAVPKSLMALGGWLDSVLSLQAEPFHARMPYEVEIR